jgi:outer membrane protein OmpA-like peptidoglycan-associated protein
MKRLLLASAAIGVLAMSFAGSASAQSRDNFQLKALCNPALGLKCSTGTPQKKTIKTAPVRKATPQVKIVKPQIKPQIKIKPKIKIAVPQKTKPQAPRVLIPKVKIAVPQQVTPQAPRVLIPKVKIAVPQQVTPKTPSRVIAPKTGTVVFTPGAVSVDDLRKRLAAELAGQGKMIKVAPQPRAPSVTIDPTHAQVQADLVALRDVAAVAVAAAGLSGGAVKIVDKTLTLQDVRLSSQDFSGGLGKTPTLDFSAVDMDLVLNKGDRVVTNTGDRVVVENNGVLRVLRNDDVLLDRPGTEVQMVQFKDGSTRNMMAYEDGSQVETIRAVDGRVLRRTSILADGSEVVLFDDTQPTEQVMVNDLPAMTGPTVVAYRSDGGGMTEALNAQTVDTGRSFSLAQVRDIDAVRQLAPGINIDSIHFASGSAAILPDEAEELAALGIAMLEAIALDPSEVFLIEGHTDAVGPDAYNLGLSDRRAESVALALVEYFGVPPENMILQGYGEADLLVTSAASEPANRRAAVRRITPLLAGIAS